MADGPEWEVGDVNIPGGGTASAMEQETARLAYLGKDRLMVQGRVEAGLAHGGK